MKEGIVLNNKEIKIKTIDINEYSKIIQENNILNLPIYMDSTAIKFYDNLEIIKILKGENIVALYAYPLFINGEEKWVKRKYRFLPYSSPIFIADLNKIRRKKICYEIYKYIFQKYEVVYIPLSPDFEEITSIQALGAIVEARSTNVIDNKLLLKNLDTKLRNHINHASKTIKIVINRDAQNFNFNIAIKGKDDEKEKRKLMAINLINENKGIVINAYEEDKNIAGAIVIYDNKYAYLLHTWQNESTIRGCIPLIIYNAINWCFDNLHIKYFDFEGSVIQSIDDFFSTFNTKSLLYPYIHFAKTKKNYEDILSRSINIPGRKIK